MAVVRVRGRRAFMLLLAAVSIVVTVCYFAASYRLLDVRDRILLRRFVEMSIRSGESLLDSPAHIACQRPQLAINSSDVLQFFHSVDPLVCDPHPDWVTVIGSEAIISVAVRKKHGDIECSFTEIVRDADDETVLRGLTTVTTNNFTLTTADFYRASCTAADGATWTSLVAGIRNGVEVPEGAGTPSSRGKIIDKLNSLGSGLHIKRNKDGTVDEPTPPPADGMGLNVLMFGLDSLSHNTFIRTLPNTYKYLRQVLGAEVMDGYNIVGDGTPQALIPILTGKTELELPEVRRRMGKKAGRLDEYPFIWKDFAAAGYTTLFAEDKASIGTFNYRLTGFRQPPTDHYTRPFYLSLDQELRTHRNYCMKARTRHQVFLDYVYNFMSSYRSRPVFAFAFHCELSHDDVNLVSVADDDLTKFLIRLNEENLLNNTLLIFYSDHGHRFQNVRGTQQGKQEERLPFMSIVAPEKIKTAFPAAFHNLRANTNRLVTPFDIHATLKDVLQYSGAKLGQVSQRSISLFSQIPASRTCSDAYIEPHWCACLTWEPLPVNGERVRQAGKALVHYINTHTSPHRSQCHELELQVITWAAILLPTRGLLSFKQNADVDGYVPDMSATTAVTEEVYELHVQTRPGNAQYEAALTYARRQDTFTVRLTDISRVNAYGTAPTCIMTVNPEMAKYCLCRDQPSE